MKTSRVITLVLVAVTTLLCCFPVAALDVANSYSYSNVIDNSLTQYLNVSVMYADDESYAYGTDSDVVQYYDAPTYQALVNYRVKNTSDQDANLNVSYIALDFGLQASGYNVIGVEYVSGVLEPYYVSISDFRLQQVDGTSTTVIVPAGGYISGTFIIHLQDTFDNSSGTHIQYPSFSNFNTWDTFSPTYGNYNSTVIDYVSDVYVELLDQGVSLDEILSVIQSYSIDSYDYGSVSGGRTSFASNTSGSVVSRCYSLLGLPYIYDSSLSLGVDVSGYNHVFAIPYKLIYVIRNSSDDSYVASGTNLSFSYSYNVTVPSSYSFLGSQYSFTGDFNNISYTNNGSTLTFTVIKPSGSYNGIIVPSDGSLYFILDGYLLYGSMSDSFVPFDVTFGNSFITIPNPSYSVYTTDFTDITEDIHNQESSYYDDTNTALENSGLPDYNFNSQQTGGLSGVSDDFVRVWNACGALNSVFVFSLTLSLALYILRHRRRL